MTKLRRSWTEEKERRLLEMDHGDGKDLLAIRVLSHTLGKLA
jgi:hypothetical protein